MNIYILFILFIFVFIIGYFAGFIFITYVYTDYERFAYTRKLKKKNRLVTELEDDEETVYKNISDTINNSLSARFTDQGNSFTDLVCETENFNSKEYVEEKRQHQTEAYNYTSTKENHIL